MLPTTAALSRYRSVQVTTCSPGQLLIMLYDGMFRYLGEAQAAMEANDRARFGERISRAHDILEHLLAGLDRSQNPDLCDKLVPLYQFCMHHLVMANVRQDAAMVAEVVRVLTPLRDAWRTAVAQTSSAAAAR